MKALFSITVGAVGDKFQAEISLEGRDIYETLLSVTPERAFAAALNKLRESGNWLRDDESRDGDEGRRCPLTKGKVQS